MTLQVGRLDLEHDSYHRLSSEVFGSQLKRIAGATPMCVLTRRRGAHMAHTQTDGLHTRHPLERTHTNTHNDTYNCTKKRTYVHGVKHVGAGQEQHRRLCIRFHYGTRLAFHWRLQRPPRPIAISGGKLLKSPLRRDTWTSFSLHGPPSCCRGTDLDRAVRSSLPPHLSTYLAARRLCRS